MSGEAGSRAHLDLPGNQEQLLELVASAGRPIVLLVFSGCPLVLNRTAAHVQAIVAAWFPGSEAGAAIANVLCGDVAPRMSTTPLGRRTRYSRLREMGAQAVTKSRSGAKLETEERHAEPRPRLSRSLECKPLYYSQFPAGRPPVETR